MLQVRHRLSFFYVERGTLAVIDGCLVLTDSDDRTQYEVPARATTTIMVGPGASVTTDAMRLAGRYGLNLVWVGEYGVRCYSAGRNWSENTAWLEQQVRAYADPERSLAVALEMYYRRFGARLERRTLDELRGMEGARVREFYRLQAANREIPWRGRSYVPGNPDGATDAANLALNVINTCLYGLVETACHATGMSPALGFIHRGKAVSFVLDIADLYKFEHAIPIAFGVVARHKGDGTAWSGLESEVRRTARDHFRRTKLLDRVVDDMTSVVDAGHHP